jgi:penicillin-insensitive murein DD-endopeptidase
MKYNLVFITLLLLVACQNSTRPDKKEHKLPVRSDFPSDPNVIAEYQKEHRQTAKSESLGSVSNGELKNGYLVPFSGANFRYFDTTSYLSGRAFVNQAVYKTLIDSYKTLEDETEVFFGLMECSNEHGGKIWPHRTHQNGLSCDFMSPILKNGVPTTDLNDLGANHYFMDFDKNGVYKTDRSYSIDFNTIAQHLLVLNRSAAKFGLQIEKVILKIELKDELFATEYGKELKKTGIYFATSLSRLINELHDDHYHVDFKPI